MDELEISGKRYISSRRAAKEHGYHIDYIGQLVRAGKIVGTKIGRAWYVEDKSLAKYFGKEGKNTTTVQEKKISIHKIVKKEEEKIEEDTQKIVQIPIKVENIPALEVKEMVIRNIGLRYIADEESLLPKIIQQITREPATKHTDISMATAPSTQMTRMTNRLPPQRGNQTIKRGGEISIAVFVESILLISIIIATYFLSYEITINDTGMDASIKINQKNSN